MPLSGYSEVLEVLEDDLTNDFHVSANRLFPPGLYAPIPVKSRYPVIKKKAAIQVTILKRFTLEHIYASYSSSIHVFTDGSTTSASSILGVYIPLTDEPTQRQLGHVMSSTAAELVAIR